MRTIEACRHCGYRIPSTAAICPGCGRRHPVELRIAPRAAEPAARTAPLVPAAEPTTPALAPADSARPAPHPPRRRHGPLLRTARWTRRLLALTAWVAASFGVAALVRYVLGLDRFAGDVTDLTIERAGAAAAALAVATLVVLLLAIAATVTWARAARRNLAHLDLTPSRTSAWSLLGWLVPGRAALTSKHAVDALWRDSSPTLVDLPKRGWSRRPVSRVVLRWWSSWSGVPAVAILIAVVVSGPDDLGGDLGLAGLVGAALTVAAVRALYDIVGVVTVAQAHRAEAVLRRRAESAPWTDHDEGWADAADHLTDDDADPPVADDVLEPLPR